MLACQGTNCAMGACFQGYGDCNGMASDGCEIDLQHDPANCGTCGHACTGGTACKDGLCVTACPAPLTYCAGTQACVNLATNAQNCNACGAACPAGNYCNNGTCAPIPCPAGLVRCGGACVDTTSDPLNCGSCNHVCKAANEVNTLATFPGDQAVVSCVSSACQQCPTGLLAVGNDCVDPQRTRNHCGAATAKCTLSEVCVGGTCAPLSNYTLVAGVSVGDIQTDGQYVFYPDLSAGTINRIPVTGGSPTVLASGAALAAGQGIAIDALYVYYYDGTTGKLSRVAKAGGTPQPVVASSYDEIQVDGQNVYFTSGKAVYSVPKAGGTATMVFDGSSFKKVHWLRQNTSSVFVMTIYSPGPFIDFTEYLKTIPKAGGAVQSAVVASAGVMGGTQAYYLAVDDTNYYAASSSATKYLVASTSLAGGSSQYLWFGGIAYQTSPTGATAPLVLDGGNLFFITGGIRKIANCSNQFASLVVDVPATMLVANGGYVYWSDGGMIGRIAE